MSRKIFARILNLLFFLTAIFATFYIVSQVARSLVLFELPAVSGVANSEYKFVLSLVSASFAGNITSALLVFVTPVVLLLLSLMFALFAKKLLKFHEKFVMTSLFVMVNFVILVFVASIGLFYGYYQAKTDYSQHYYDVVERFDSDPGSFGLITDQKEILDIFKVNGNGLELNFKLFSIDETMVIFEGILENNTQDGDPQKYSGFAIVDLSQELWTTVKPEIFASDYFEYQGTLYLKNVSKRSYNKISLEIAKVFVKKSFPFLVEKADPKVSIVTLEELKVIKNERISKSLEVINEAINDINSWIDLYEKDLVTIRGYYKSYGGTFWQNEISYDENQIAQLKSDLADWQESKRFFSEQLDKDPYEYGIFYYPDTTYLVLDRNFNDNVMTFIPTIVHEYLHYVSYDTRVNYDDISGFEEGVTDYITSRVIMENLNEEANPGYPELVGIVEVMNSQIPDDSLVNAYISGDKERMIGLIKTTYGESFYSDNIGLINSLAYPVEQEKETDVFNKVMNNLKAAWANK